MAFNLFQQGKLFEAESLLQSMIKDDRNNYDAIHYLGILKASKKEFEEGLELIRLSLRQPHTLRAYSENYVTTLFQAERYHDVIEVCAKILAKLGETETLQYILGCSLSKQGRHTESVIVFDKLLANNPNNTFANNDKGVSLSELGCDEEALTCVLRALQLSPQFSDAYINKGNVLGKLKRYEEAIDAYRKAIQLDPLLCFAYLGLANVYRNLKRYDEALAGYEKALSIKPELAEAWLGRGNVFADLKHYDEALAACDKALSIKSDFAEAWLGRGNVFADLKRYAEAFAAYDKALSIKPNLESAWLGRGNAYNDLKRYDEAFAAYDKALSIKPDFAEAWLGLGNTKLNQGKAQDAIAAFDKASALLHDFSGALSNRIFALDFTDIGFAEQQDVRKQWWQKFGSRISPLPLELARNQRDPGRPLTIGYVSGDFRRHSAALCFGPVLRNHDKSRFKIICYSNSVVWDDRTAEFANSANQWREVISISDEALATQIWEDKVDILVDLSGHSAGNRLKVFARKPAPIQVTAWGHATGTGLPTIDYLFSDPVAIPPEARPLFAETIVDLPCLITIEASPDGLASAEPPFLTKGYVTFGVFNRTSKVTDQAIFLWSRILLGVPDSLILFKGHGFDSPTIRSRITDLFANGGVDPQRITFRDGSPWAEHLSAFREVDISLDPFPQNGGVSTWESLQMGVPVVTKLGNSVPSRLAAAINSSIGLGEWVADDDEQYLKIALDFARHPDRLRPLRGGLPEQVAQSAAGNAVLYTRVVESAYEAMYQRYQAGLPLDRRD
jgi:predicted O-linked N-acetylglucosamine transferase (SPINDLY family)